MLDQLWERIKSTKYRQAGNDRRYFVSWNRNRVRVGTELLCPGHDLFGIGSGGETHTLIVVAVSPLAGRDRKQVDHTDVVQTSLLDHVTQLPAVDESTS